MHLLMRKLNYLLANMPVGIIKSVQSGRVSGGLTTGTKTREIKINAVNLAKTFVVGGFTTSANSFD